MNNKVSVKLSVPEIDETYDLYLPINKKIGNILILLNKLVNELSNGVFPLSNYNQLYNSVTGERYRIDVILAKTNIKNCTKLILLSGDNYK